MRRPLGGGGGGSLRGPRGCPGLSQVRKEEDLIGRYRGKGYPRLSGKEGGRERLSSRTKRLSSAVWGKEGRGIVQEVRKERLTTSSTN